MKRALSVLLSLCFVLLYPLAALAEETPYIPFETRHLTLSMETAANSVAPGSVFTVNVRVENNTGFETLKITPILGEGLVLSGTPVNGTVSSANGADAFSFYTAGGTTATGILVTFNVQVNASALSGAVSLGLNVREATDQEGQCRIDFSGF